jgi:thioredoxin reductase
MRNWLKHLRFTEVTEKQEVVLNVAKALTVTTEKKKYRSRVAVIATGTRLGRLRMPNEIRFRKKGRSVYYFASHPEEFLGKKVLVVETQLSMYACLLVVPYPHGYLNSHSQ